MKQYITKPVMVKEVREEVLQALDRVSSIVCSTMGPGGRNVTVHSDGGITTTKDGVTVARYLSLPGEIDNLVALMAVDASAKTVKEVGDGTTTSVMMLYAIYREVYEMMEEADMGINLFKVGNGIDRAVDIVRERLMAMAMSLKDADGGVDREKLRDVAIISANNDEILGRMIADIVYQVGENGFVEVRDSMDGSTYTEKSEGYVFPTIALKEFIPNGKGNVEVLNPVIFLADMKISDYDEIREIIQSWQRNCRVDGVLRPLVMIVSDIEGSALSTMTINSKKMPIVVVKAPGFGSVRNDILGDIRVVTGTRQVFNHVTGNTLDRFGKDLGGYEEKEFGSADKVVVYKDKVVIVRSSDYDVEVLGLVENLKGSIEVSESESERSWLKERIGRLTGGVGTIYVGANSELELGFKKMVIDDAQRACFTAMDGGVVIGGGNALVKCVEWMKGSCDEYANDATCDVDVLLGMEAVLRSLTYPYERILGNMFVSVDGGILEEIVDGGNKFHGYNVKAGYCEDLFEAGIIDPVKVTVSAVKNAASVAKQLLTTEWFLFLESSEAMDMGKLFYPER